MKLISVFISELILFYFHRFIPDLLSLKCDECVNMWCSIKKLTKIPVNHGLKLVTFWEYQPLVF